MATHRSYYQYIILFVVLACSCNPGRAGPPLAKHGCRESCGNVIIPFPFGVSKHCYLEEKFLITCNESTGIPKAYLEESNFEVTSIFLYGGELQVLNDRGKDCYNENGSIYDHWNPSFWLSSFTLSPTRNKFVAIGCDTYAIVEGYTQNDDYDGDDPSYTTGCMSICNEYDYRSCSGVGCCEITNIPSGLGKIVVEINSYYNHTKLWNFNPCSYAFVVEDTWFNFSKTSFQLLNNTEKVPMIIDWSIGNKSCEGARRRGNLLCNENNSRCIDSSTGAGYVCECKRGYEGNPYHPEGCQDTDECNDPNYCNPWTCHNTPGSFTCSCGKGYTQNGTDCSKVIKESDRYSTIIVVIISMSSGLGALVLSVITWRLFKFVKKRKVIKRREKFFKQNGGLLLQQEISSGKTNVEKTKVFNSKELEKATENFNIDRVLGQGGQGTVYKGMLTDGNIVAVKKSKIADQTKVAEFINEVVILSQINHRNVVKLLGCCLDTQVPLLVYEFIPNGTLSQYIHEQNEEFPFTWEIRLRVAKEVAGAISYLHSSASFPIYHRDIKSSNILLDEKYRAKVADFGTSRTISLDQTHLTTLVYGTFGYLDPEYFQSSQFTEKSDVYSFGVVLVELLTGQKAVSITRSAEEGRSLATYFIITMEEDRLFEILEAQVMRGPKEEIVEVANLAKRCLDLNGRKRPTMKEVAMELEGIHNLERASAKELQNCEEVEYVRTESIEPWDVASTSTGSDLHNDGRASLLQELPLLSFKSC